MLRILFLFLVCLVFFGGGVVAAAIDTLNTTAVSPGPVPASTTLAAPNIAATASDPLPKSCDDIHNCRTLYSIVQTCLLTIFACIWVAVHRNIPGPKQSWIYVQLECLKVVVLTLLVPEWILAWSVRQWFNARYVAKELEGARMGAQRNWEKKRETVAIQEDGQGTRDDIEEGDESNIGYRESGSEVHLMQPRRTPTDINGEGTGGEELVDTWTRETRLGRNDESWTKTHGFFVIMGGFHFYNDGKAVSPLDYRDVVDLVQRGRLVLPTSNELNDKSKGDTLSKSVAIVQTLWFVMQFIARGIKNLPITNLEVMTLAYTVITLAMYAAWWHKPLNISCPIRVPGIGKQGDNRYGYETIWQRTIKYVMGDQDWLVKLSDEERIPTFWSGQRGDNDEVILADVVALIVAMVFGAVHCIAWHYTFPSHAEQLIWRASAISIAVVPVGMIVMIIFTGLGDRGYTPKEIVGVIFLAILIIFYILGRLILLILSFSTLRSPLSAGVYQTVQWTTFIPHV